MPCAAEKDDMRVRIALSQRMQRRQGKNIVADRVRPQHQHAPHFFRAQRYRRRFHLLGAPVSVSRGMPCGHRTLGAWTPRVVTMVGNSM